MNEARWFVAHRRDAEDADIDETVQDIGARLRAQMPDWLVTVVPGRDDFNARAAAAGGYRPWIDSVIRGTDATGQPRFHGVIVPGNGGAPIGRATADLVEGMMALGKHVVAFDAEAGRFPCIGGLVDAGVKDARGRRSFADWALLVLKDDIPF